MTGSSATSSLQPRRCQARSRSCAPFSSPACREARCPPASPWRELRKCQDDTAASASVGTIKLGKKAWLADDGGTVDGGYLELVRAGQRLGQTVAVM